MLAYFMSLPIWVLRTLAGIGFFIIGYLGILYSIAYNKMTSDWNDCIKEPWIVAWAMAWPLVSIYYPIHKMITTGFLQRWLYDAPVLYIANKIEESKKKKIEKYKIPEKDFVVKNDWRD